MGAETEIAQRAYRPSASGQTITFLKRGIEKFSGA